jgi:hypothetical protein
MYKLTTQRVRLYLKVLLNGNFKPLFFKKKFPNKAQYLKCLKECIIKTLMKVYYPYNIDINYKDNVDVFNLLTISKKKGVLIYIECDLNMPVSKKEVNPEDIERNIRVFNLHPSFFKYITVLRYRVLSNQ